MKLTNLSVQNFLGARAVEVRLTTPVTLFAGKNGAGKSSIQEAVRMALTGEAFRVGLKKDYGALISEGQYSGFVEVGIADNAYSVVLPSGKGAHCDAPALSYVLDAQRFAKLDDNERRSFLFGLMGVKLDGPAVKQRLLGKGCVAAKVEQVAPILRAGFDAAAKEAASKARDAKASWKTATGGETWGKDKAPKWQPAPLPVDAEKAVALLENINVKLADADKELAAAQVALGAAEAEQRHIAKAAAERAELAEKAAKVERFSRKLNLDTAELAAWEQKVETTRAKAGAAPAKLRGIGNFDDALLRGLAAVTADFIAITCEYDDVAWDPGLLNRAAVHLAEFRKLHGEPTPAEEQAQPDREAAAKLPEYEQALALLQSSVANGKRDLEAAQQAAAKLVELDNQTQSGVDMETPRAKVAELTEKRNAWRADLDKYRGIADQYKRRQAAIEQAAKLHADVMDWTAIADALAPDGIPSELLAEALGPINARLEQSAADAEWPRMMIDTDMSILKRHKDRMPRPYALLSESEKWRADAMIAEAVSFLAGVKLLVLDRFDVLDLKGREDLLYWLDGMAEAGEIETALIFGTLKALPAGLPETVQAFWIEGGVVGQMREAA